MNVKKADFTCVKTQHRNKTVIAHRGNCSVLPQNTLEAIISGLHNSDLIEFDIHPTKDEQVIVFHDRSLSRTTNIRNHPEFTDHSKTQTIDDDKEQKHDFWVRDFTFQELQTLDVIQPIKYRPQLENLRFKISKLQNILEQCLKVTNSEIHYKKMKTGLLIQLKEQVATELNEKDRILCRKTLQILNKFGLDTLKGCETNNLRIVLQSFNIPMLIQLKQSQLQQVQLYDKHIEINEQLLNKNKIGNIIGIGITQQNLLDQDKNACQRVGKLCEKLNYSLFYWTIRDDDEKKIPFGCTRYQEVYLLLLKIGVTGFITQFPDKCKGLHNLDTVMYSKGNLQIEAEWTANICKARKASECSSVDSLSTELKKY